MLLRHSALYLTANIAAAAIGLASVMLLTRLVTPSAYGIYVVTVGLANVLSTLYFTWLRQAILRFETGLEADVRLAALAGYGLTLLLYPVAVASLIWLGRLEPAIAIAAATFAAALGLFELGQEVLRARQRVARYMFASVLRTCVALVFALVAVSSGGGGLALVYVMAFGYAAAAAVNARHVWQRPLAPFDRATLSQLARYGLPITLSGLFVALNLTLDRFALAWLAGPEAAGAYGASADFVRQGALLPAVSASLAIAPLALSAMNATARDSVARHLAEGGELLLAIVLPTVAGLAIVAPDVAVVMFGPDYRTVATAVIPIVAFAYAAHLVSQQYVQVSFALARKPGLFIVHTGAILAVNAALMIPLTTRLGPTGAALSLLVSECAGVVLGLALARRAYPVPLLPRPAARIAACVVAMAAAVLAARHGSMLEAGISRLVVTVAAGVAAYGAAALVFDVVGLRRHSGRFIAQWRLRGAAT